MDCPNGCAVSMKQIKVERIFYRKNGEPLVIRDLTMNICSECGQESMPLKSARMVEDILNGKIKPIGQFMVHESLRQ